MIAKGLVMIEDDRKIATFHSTLKNDDRKIATFHSTLKNGDIELWYCAHRNVYKLRYDVQFYTPDGLTDATSLMSYDAGDYIQIGDILTDAIELANTSLLKRD